MHYPKISILTAVLNAKNTIEKTLESVFCQNYPNLEFIVMDGGSTDGTMDIIQKYANKIHYFKSQRDRGPMDAYSQAAKIATGDFFAMLSADDWYEPGLLHAIGTAIVQYPDVDVISCGAQLIENNAGDGYHLIKKWTGKDLDFTLRNIIECPISNARFLRKNVLEQYGDFIPCDSNNKYIIASDTEFMIRLAMHNVKYHTIEKMGHTYLKHPNSLTLSNNSKNTRQIHQEHLAIYETYINDSTIDVRAKKIILQQHIVESVHAFIREMLAGHFKLAFHSAKRGIKLNALLWPFYSLWLPTKKIIEKLICKLKNHQQMYEPSI